MSPTVVNQIECKDFFRICFGLMAVILVKL